MDDGRWTMDDGIASKMRNVSQLYITPAIMLATSRRLLGVSKAWRRRRLSTAETPSSQKTILKDGFYSLRTLRLCGELIPRRGSAGRSRGGVWAACPWGTNRA